MLGANEIRPMLAVDHPQPFDSPDYLFEIKWDGYRCIAYCDHQIRLVSRGGVDLTAQFPEIAADLVKLPTNCILDGELIMLDQNGKPDFHYLRRKQPHDLSTYVVFDLLSVNQQSQMELPLLERKNRLSSLIGEQDFSRIVVSQVVDRYGTRLFQAAVAQNLEGIVGKRKDSKYLPGIRSRAWLKIKRRLTIDAVIVGYIEGQQGLKSLILGLYENDNLRYIGNVGTGFSEQEKVILHVGLRRIRGNCPLKTPPPITHAVWVKPLLVAEISYLEFTPDKKLRQPSFVCLRHDKLPKECGFP